MAEPPAPGGLRDGAVVLAVVRSLVLAFLFPYVAWLTTPHKPWIFVILGVASVAHAVFVWTSVRAGRQVTAAVAQVTIVIDTIAIGVGVFVTGGTVSAAAMIWAPNLAIGAVWVGVRAMLPALALVITEMTVLGVTGAGEGPSSFTEGQTAVMVGFMLTMLVVVGGVVAQRQRATMRALDSAEARARRDPLTGLLNRTAIEDRTGQELARARRSETSVTLLMIDLDDFKDLNDTRGHLVGDLALISIANLLLSDKRTSDSAARLGGEEFLMLLPDTSEAEGVAIADRLRERIAGTAPAGIRVTASIGLACFPEHARTALELLIAADSALYRAKGAGKNCVAVYDGTAVRPTGGGPGDPAFAAALARHAATIAFDQGLNPDDVQAVRTAALLFGIRGEETSDRAINAILAQAQAITAGELADAHKTDPAH